VIGKNQHTLFHHSRSDGLPYPHQECPVYLTLHDGIRRDLNETFIRQNNEMFPVRMTATPIRDGQEITGAVVVFQDITDEMQRLQRLRLLETAVNATANSIVITDQNGTIEWINPAMSRLTGYSLKEAVGQNPRVLKSGAHEDTYYAGLWQTISAGYVWHGDVASPLTQPDPLVLKIADPASARQLAGKGVKGTVE
jgi:PAS domain-containing protein